MKKTTPWRVPAPIGVVNPPATVIAPVPVSFPYIGLVCIPRVLAPGSMLNCVPNVMPCPCDSNANGIAGEEKPLIVDAPPATVEITPVVLKIALLVQLLTVTVSPAKGAAPVCTLKWYVALPAPSICVPVMLSTPFFKALTTGHVLFQLAGVACA